MAELKVHDKRKFTAEGEVKEPDCVHCHRPASEHSLLHGGLCPTPDGATSFETPVAVSDAEVSRFLAEAPKVYDDPRPLNDRVLIKQHAVETVYAGTTFVIPDVAQKNPNAGVVIAIGPEVDSEKDCGPNDLVIFNRYSAEEITLDGEQFVHVSKHDIHLRQRVTYAVSASH